MGDRFYNHGCPKKTWENGIAFLPRKMKRYAKECVCPPPSGLMGDKPVQEGWVYFFTHKFAEKMDRVLEAYLATLAWESYGSW